MQFLLKKIGGKSSNPNVINNGAQLAEAAETPTGPPLLTDQAKIDELCRHFPRYNCFYNIYSHSLCDIFKADNSCNSNNSNCDLRNEYSTKVRPIAIKKLTNLLGTAGNLSEFKKGAFWVYREMSILRQLKHRNIIQLIDVLCPRLEHNEDSPGSVTKLIHLKPIYLVFELLQCDLAAYMRNNHYTLSINGTKNIFAQLLIGLQYLHSANVIHRDLKPQNILICQMPNESDKFVLKIADFGLSKIVEKSQICKPSARIESNIDYKGAISVNESVPDTIYSNANEIDDTLALDEELVGPNEDEAMLDIPHVELLSRQMSVSVASEFYRAPEILLMLDYNSSVDIWSAGCILHELFMKVFQPENRNRKLFDPKLVNSKFFDVSTELRRDVDDLSESGEQLYIFMNELTVILWTLGKSCLMGFSDFGLATEHLSRVSNEVEKLNGKDFNVCYNTSTNESGIDFLHQFIHFSPKRWTAEESLRHSFITSELEELGYNSCENTCSKPLDICLEHDLREENILHKLLQELSYFKRESRL